MLPRLTLTALCVLLLAATAAPSRSGAAPLAVQRYDFQSAGVTAEPGYTAVTPADAYAAGRGYGFTVAPTESSNSRRHSWNIFSRTVTVDQAIPAAVLSDATRDAVGNSRPAPFTFRADVPPGQYDVTVWLGDVTKPLFQVRASVNGVPIDVERMDVLITRGQLGVTTLPGTRTPSIGNAVPRTVRVDAPDGKIEVTLGPDADPAAISWTFTVDQCKSLTAPQERTEVITPAFAGAWLQALTLHPAADPPLVYGGSEGTVALAPGVTDPALAQFVAAFNAGDMAAARAAIARLTGPAQAVARADALLWLAGHPATVGDEAALLADAAAALATHLSGSPDDHAAADLALQVDLAAEAEAQRVRYGYGGTPAVENLGRSNSLTEQFQPDHPYYLKGRILWLRNRGGLDPNRCTASWERAQWLAGALDGRWGAVNPHVRLYATDQWANDGAPWTFIDWGALAGPGPDWARAQLATLNAWLDLFEWWAIHRQSAEGDIGGGWTDDVEIVPAFGLTAMVLEDASDISRHATLQFADGLWNSEVMDRERGYQPQYGDVEHTAEPSGYGLTMYPMLRPGDPAGLERIMRSARTFRDLFLTTAPGGHTHFAGNHMSSTQIAIDPNHHADIPLNARVSIPFPHLITYASNPGLEGPFGAWMSSWVADAARTDKGKPAGVFPNAVWVPDDEIGFPGTQDWYSAQATYGQFSAFPAYHNLLYGQIALLYLRTGDARYLAPFDAVQDLTLAWAAAGRPAVGAAPTPGQEALWAGGKLAADASVAAVISELARLTGDTRWDRYLSRFATGYGRFLRQPTEATLLNDGMQAIAAELARTWPYRTTEGVMTDRILLPGWGNVVSYYLGADWATYFFGLAQPSVTWRGTGRLFAAAIHKATTRELAATAYRFADTPATVTLRPWSLRVGGSYVLEAGPAAGLAAEPSTVAVSVPFTVAHRGDGASFELPGRTTYAIRIREVTPGAPVVPALPDLAIAARDVAYDAATGEVKITVHNIGAADAGPFPVHVHEGRGEAGRFLYTGDFRGLAAPTDLVPKTTTFQFGDYRPGLPAEITVLVDVADMGQPEITKANNVVTAVIGGPAPDYPPPMLLALAPRAVAPGGAVDVSGRHFRPGLAALSSGSAVPWLTAQVIDAGRLALSVAPGAPLGTVLVSVRNPDGQGSNLLPLIVGDQPATPTPGPTATSTWPAGSATATRTPGRATATATRGRITATPTVGRMTRTPTPPVTSMPPLRQVLLPLALKGTEVPAGPTSLPVPTAAPTQAAGVERVVVLLVDDGNSADARLSPDDARRVLADVKGWYAEVSYGHSDFQWDVHGWYEIAMTAGNGTDPRIFAAAAAAGVDFRRYDHSLVLFHGGTGFGSSSAHPTVTVTEPGGGTYALPTTLSQVTRLRDTASVRGVIAHELGHALGLPHANHVSQLTGEIQAYGTRVDTMGTASLRGHFNAYYKHVLGWIPAADVRTASGSGVFTLAPQERSTGARLLVIPGDADGVPAYVVETRRAIGADATLDFNTLDGALVYRVVQLPQRDEESDARYQVLSLDASPETPSATSEDFALMAGRTWSDPELGLHITVLAVTADATTVQVVRGPAAGNRPPALALSAEPLADPAGAVRFRATVSDPDGQEVSVFWNFEVEGEASGTSGRGKPIRYQPGRYGSGVDLTHAFADTTPGTVCAEASDRHGGVTRACAGVFGGTNAAPTINGAQAAPRGPRAVQLQATLQDAQPLWVRWDFGDGTSSDVRSPTHAYAQPGTYTARLTVTDGEHTATAEVPVDARQDGNMPPVADAGPDQVVAPGQAVILDGSKSHDPDRYPIQLRYIWSAPAGILLSATNSARTTFTAPTAIGPYTFTLKVYDGAVYGQDDVVVRVTGR